MTTIPPERAKELRDGLITIKQEALKKGWNDDVLDCDDTIAILDDYSALKGEVKRLNAWHSTLSEAWKARAIKAEAELERQAPLIEAVMGANVGMFGWVVDPDAPPPSSSDYGPTIKQVPNFDSVSKSIILRAALALREEKK